MDVIKRNFFKAIRSGVFNTKEQLEPMSLFKWQQLVNLAIKHGLAQFVIKALQDEETHPCFCFPNQTLAEWDKIRKDSVLNSKPLYDMDEYKNLRMNNFFLNRRLKKIVHNELHSIDTNTETLRLLSLYISITTHILRDGIQLNEIIRLGYFLRRNGDRVDYVKFESWINRLKMRHIVTLESSVLIQLFDFSHDEFPFMDKEEENAKELILRDISSLGARDMHFSQGNGAFVHNKNNRATLWHICHSARLMKYYPLETTSNFIHSFASSLSEIEE